MLRLKINQRINEFIQENQRYPSTTEIAELVDLDRSIVQSIITANKFSTSLDSTFPDDDTPIMDTVAGNENVDENLETESLYSDLHSVLSGILSSREIGILCSYYGIGCQEETLEEMGIKYNLSRERVRQIKENSLKKIRKSSSINVLKKYL